MFADLLAGWHFVKALKGVNSSAKGEARSKIHFDLRFFSHGFQPVDDGTPLCISGVLPPFLLPEENLKIQSKHPHFAIAKHQRRSGQFKGIEAEKNAFQQFAAGADAGEINIW